MIRSGVLAVSLLISSFIFAQNREIDRRWYIKSLAKDGVYGTAVVEAARMLAGKQPGKQKLVVAVIDSGTDVDHVYLQDYLWKNEGEIPGNGIDDDGNGYVDDVHGWSFIPDRKDGSAMVTPKGADRLFFELLETKGQRPLNRKESELMNDLRRLSALPMLYDDLKVCRLLDSMVQRVTVEASKKLDPKFINKRNVRHYLVSHENLLSDNEKDMLRILETMISAENPWVQIQRSVKQRREELEKEFETIRRKTKRDDRTLVGDDPDNVKDCFYGESFLGGKNAAHGTHVAGTVVRMVKAVEDVLKIELPVKVMTLKAIPSGDEYDKDVALAIRYAVDNGAKVINMSFGKTTVTHGKWVAKALDYASRHDVVVVHAASNENRNLEEVTYYPTPFGGNGRPRKNMITVGASDIHGLPANFSNYGKHTVDFFAPGVDIFASIPGNVYTFMSGTSMAAPVVSGLAAILRVYFPTLKASEVKRAMVESRKNTPAAEAFGMIRNKPGIHGYADLCRTNGVIDFVECIKWVDRCKE